MDLNLAAIAGTAIAILAGLVTLWLRSAQDQRTGARLEAAKVEAITTAAEIRIAQAEVDAPHSDAELAARLHHSKDPI